MQMLRVYVVKRFLVRQMESKSKITFSNRLFFGWVEEEIAAGRRVRFAVKGYSMMPLLRSEIDEVVLEPCSSESIKVGDILLFRYMGNHILHRVIDIKEYCPEYAAGVRKEEVRCGCSWYILRGDNVIGRREVAPSCDVIGRVRDVYRKTSSGEFVRLLPTSFRYRVRMSLRRLLILVKIMIKRLLAIG